MGIVKKNKIANLRSDVSAKKAFGRLLHSEGYSNIKICRSPVDLTATRNRKQYFFEVKYTAQRASYFGAATLSEWEAALKHRKNFWFVVAHRRRGKWVFVRYSPTEFMRFSYIPPFKIFFHVTIGVKKATMLRKRIRAISLTPAHLRRMSSLFKDFRKLTGKV